VPFQKPVRSKNGNSELNFMQRCPLDPLVRRSTTTPAKKRIKRKARKDVTKIGRPQDVIYYHSRRNVIGECDSLRPRQNKVSNTVLKRSSGSKLCVNNKQNFISDEAV
jgi:hypothetical protein